MLRIPGLGPDRAGQLKLHINGLKAHNVPEGRGSLNRFKAQLEERKAALKPKRPSDVGEILLHQEIRARLSSMSKGEFAAAIGDSDAVVLAAALTAPFALPGMTPDLQALAEVRLFGPALAQIREDEQAVGLIESAWARTEREIEAAWREADSAIKRAT
jgi:hypothetical protein